MADVDDEFDREFGIAPSVDADATPDDPDAAFDAEFGVAPEAPAPPQREAGTGETWMDALLGLGEGASLGHGAELGNWGAKIGNALADAKFGKTPGTKVGDENIGGELVARSQETGLGQAGKLAGGASTAIAAGGLAAPTLGAQAATGAALGAIQAEGDHGMDPWAILTGMGAGGALGAGGAALGKAMSLLAGPAMRGGVPGTGSRAAQISEELLGKLPRGATSPLLGAGLGAASSAYGGDISPGGLAKGALSGAAVATLAPKLLGEGAISALGRMGPKVARLGTALAPAAAGMAGPSSASAQDAPGQMRTAPIGSMPGSRTTRAEIGEPEFQRWQVQTGEAELAPDWRVEVGDVEMHEPAYATPATASWAVQSVLASPDSGLSPKEQQRLVQAATSGNEDELISASFALQQSNAAYATRLQRELEQLQESAP